MLKAETSLTRQLWKELGGTLFEEFPLGAIRGRTNAPRWADGLIDKNGPKEISKLFPKTLAELEVIVVHAWSRPLGMFLIGQTLSSVKLIDKFHKPKSIEGYILCTKDDGVLRALMRDEYPFIKIKVFETPVSH